MSVRIVGITADTCWYIRCERRDGRSGALRVRATLANLVAYTVFPVVAGLVGHSATLGHGVDRFVLLVAAAYLAAFLTNVVIISLFNWSEDHRRFLSEFRLNSTGTVEIWAGMASGLGVLMLQSRSPLGFAFGALTVVLFMEMAGEYLSAKENKKKEQEARLEAQYQTLLLEHEASHRLYDHRAGIATALQMQQAMDPHLARHSVTVAIYLRALSTAMGNAAEVVRLHGIIALLHDIGKATVPLGVLLYPGPVNRFQMLLLRDHSEHGARILRHLAGLGNGAEVINSHHERYDGGLPGAQFWGRGYPDGLSGEEILLLARMIAVCDTYEAMTCRNFTGRYKTHEEAVAELIRQKGKQFDPDIVDVFVRVLEENPDLRFNPDHGQLFAAELAAFLGTRPSDQLPKRPVAEDEPSNTLVARLIRGIRRVYASVRGTS